MNHAIPKESHSHKREAFTLIELITVIGIIGILAAILFPSIRMVMDKSKEIACANNMRQWGTAMGMYLDEHRGVFPKDGANGDEEKAWYNVLPQYVGLDAFSVLQANGKAPCPGMGKSIYICPSQSIDSQLVAQYASGVQSAYHLSYGMNSWINATKTDLSLSSPMRLSQVKHSALFVVFSEPKGGRSNTVNEDSVDFFKHRKRVNAVFADGHVISLARKDVNEVQWNPNYEPGKAPVSGGGNGE